jgi:hypothetical protein
MKQPRRRPETHRELLERQRRAIDALLAIPNLDDLTLECIGSRPLYKPLRQSARRSAAEVPHRYRGREKEGS